MENSELSAAIFPATALCMYPHSYYSSVFVSHSVFKNNNLFFNSFWQYLTTETFNYLHYWQAVFTEMLR